MQDDMPYESEFVQLTSTPRKAERPSYMCFKEYQEIPTVISTIWMTRSDINVFIFFK